MTAPTDWMSAGAILVAGVIVGLVFLFGFRRPQRPADGHDDDRRDLEIKRDGLVAQLRELDDTASKMTPEQADEERRRLEREAAQVLRDIDDSAGRVSVRPVARAEVHSGSSAAEQAATRRGFAWGAASTAAVALLVWFVTSSARQRTANDSPTGGGPPNTASSTQSAPPAADPALRQLEAAVQSKPDDLGLRNQLAKAYLERENLMAVFEQTQYVLKRAPSDAQALTYQAVVRMAMGQRDSAVQMLRAATVADPSLTDAWVTLAWYEMQSGHDAEAAKAIDEAARRHPEEEPRLREALQQMRAQAAEAPAGTAPTQTAGGVSVSIDIDPAARPRVRPGSVVFVIARAAGVTSGPPAAVKRLPITAFPMRIELTSADSMMGQPIPPNLRIEARIDYDGVATTKDPGEPSAAQDNVSAGTGAVLNLR